MASNSNRMSVPIILHTLLEGLGFSSFDANLMSFKTARNWVSLVEFVKQFLANLRKGTFTVDAITLEALIMNVFRTHTENEMVS